MRPISRWLVVAILCASAGALARQAPGTGLIAGRAVDHNGAPLSRVTVTLSKATGPAETPAAPFAAQRVLVDATGGFVFSFLRAGSYTLAASKSGYVDGALGRRRPGGSSSTLDLADGELITDVSIGLWKSAVIAGTVTDEAGEPVIGVAIRALRRSPVAGQTRFVATPYVTTDDRGAFRIGSLVPGSYIVAVPSIQTTLPAGVADEYQLIADNLIPRSFSAGNMTISPPGASTSVRLGEFVLQPASQAPIPPVQDGSARLAVYPPVFYPGAATPSQATVIPLSAGQTREATDLRVRAVASVRVSGTVVGPNGPVPLQRLRLVSQAIGDLDAESGFETGIAMSDSRGVFTFLGVPPGSYRVKVLKVPSASSAPASPAPEPTLWASEPLVVGDVDTSVTVKLTAGVRVSGRLEFEGSALKPAADRLAQIPIVLEPADGRSAGTFRPARPDAAGAFTTSNVPGGWYLLRVGSSPNGWTFKAAILDGKDVAETPFELGGSDVAGVAVTFIDQSTLVSGTVTSRSGSPDANAAVLFFPADRAGWVDIGVNPRRVRLIRSSRTGAYSTAGLPAGTYFAIAVDDADAAEWPDARFLETMSRLATRVTLVDRQTLSLDLRTVAVR